MERNIIIILILFSVLKSDLGFSIADWFEIDGCHSLRSAAIQKQTSLPANEPGGCLQWCGTKTVALQKSTCHCINDNQTLNRTTEDSCSQNCSDKDEKLKCGGNTSDVVSVYRESRDISSKWNFLNGSQCLTYIYPANEMGDKFVPDNCTKKHQYFCYSELTYLQKNCYREAINVKVNWYESLEDCRSYRTRFLWPIQFSNDCSESFIKEGQFWVAVYQWTNVVPSSSTTITSSTTVASSTILSTSPSFENSSTTTTSPSTTSTTSSSSTSARSTTRVPATSISMTTYTATSTKSTPAPLTTSSSFTSARSTTISDGTMTPRHEATSFQVDPPNIGLGAGIGFLVGILISITIVYLRTRNQSHVNREKMSHSASSNERRCQCVRFTSFGLQNYAIQTFYIVIIL